MLRRFAASRSRTVSASSTSYGGDITVPRSPTVAGSNRRPRKGQSSKGRRSAGEGSLTIPASYESMEPRRTGGLRDRQRRGEHADEREEPAAMLGSSEEPLWTTYDVAMLDLDGVV